MAQRRKTNKKKANQGSISPGPLALILLMIGLLALSYLRIHGHCEALGKRIRALEDEIVKIKKQRFNEECKWSNMKSPENMEATLRQHGLEMTWPDTDRVVHLPYSICRIDVADGSLSLDRKPMRVAMND